MDFDALRQELGDEYVILFRVHYLVASKFSFDDYEGFIYNVSNYDDINHLYLIADLLITDYSSVFFDYGILKKPMLFYMYDLEDIRTVSADSILVLINFRERSLQRKKNCRMRSVTVSIILSTTTIPGIQRNLQQTGRWSGKQAFCRLGIPGRERIRK